MSNQYNEALITDMARIVETSSADRNQELFPLVAAGTSGARTRMIEDNMPLVITRVDTYIGICPNLNYLRDDMTSVGFCGLTQAVNSIASGNVANDGNVTGYLSTAIQRAIAEFVAEEEPIAIPQRTQQAARAQGEPLTPPQVVNGILDAQTVAADFIEEVDVRDLFESCCNCEEERTFLAMREAGYIYQEIADVIGYPLSSTYVLAQELEARIQRKLEMLR